MSDNQDTPKRNGFGGIDMSFFDIGNIAGDAEEMNQGLGNPSNIIGNMRKFYGLEGERDE